MWLYVYTYCDKHYFRIGLPLSRLLASLRSAITYIDRSHCSVLTRGVHRTHTPRRTSTGYSAATIDVTSLPIASNKCCRVYCVRVWPHPRCGSDRLPYIQQRAYYIVKLKRWGQMLRIIGNSWKNSLNEAP